MKLLVCAQHSTPPILLLLLEADHAPLHGCHLLLALPELKEQCTPHADKHAQVRDRRRTE